MLWDEVRAMHPDQWMVIEILESRTESDRFIIDRFRVLELCADADESFRRYRELRRAHASELDANGPQRELSWIHTSWEKLELETKPCIWHSSDAPRDPT